MTITIKTNQGEYIVKPEIPVKDKREALQWFVNTFIGSNTMILIENNNKCKAVPVGAIESVEANEG